MLTDYCIISIVAFLISICSLALLRRFVKRTKVLTSQGIPLVGGIAFGASFLVASLIGMFLYRNSFEGTLGILIASSVMLVFGIIDDVRELSVPAKFTVQIVATTLLIFFGVKTQIVYIGNLANILITYLWVLGITNALNHLDVMDGLASGAALIMSLAFFIICILNKDFGTGILSLALGIANAGFLFYNVPPARVYMGNAGSHFLGFVLSVIAISISYAPMGRKIALLTPLVIMSLPILDTAFLIVIRLLKKNLPFNKSDDHPALRLLIKGYSKKKALCSMLMLCAFYALCGVLVSQVPTLWAAVILAFVIMVGLTATYWVGKIGVHG